MRTGVETIHTYFEAIRAADLDARADVFTLKDDRIKRLAIYGSYNQ